MEARQSPPRRPPRFELGVCYMTPGAIVALVYNRLSAVALLRRHVSGDYGDLCAEDRAANEAALRTGARILSSYPLADGQKVWIITEADRSATTILTPDEY
jgi:hypothetical protein